MLVGSAVALIFTGVSLAFCSRKEELLRLRDAGASQGGSFLPARGGRPTRVASAAERAPQMAPEARGKVPPEMPQVWTSVASSGGMRASGGWRSKQQKETSRQPQACPWRTRRATRSPYGA